MTLPLDSNVQVVQWIGLFAHGLSTVVPLVYAMFYAMPKHREIKTAVTAGIFGVATFMYLCLLIGQGTTVRSDLVEADYGTWAFESTAFLLYGLLIGYVYNMHQSTRLISGTVAGAIGIALLLSSISVGDRIWVWYAVACVLYVAHILVTSLYPKLCKSKNKDGIPAVFHVLKALFLVNLGLYIVFFALGKSAADVISPVVSAVLILIADLMRVATCFSIIFRAFDAINTVKVAEENDKKDDSRTGLQYDDCNAQVLPTHNNNLLY